MNLLVLKEKNKYYDKKDLSYVSYEICVQWEKRSRKNVRMNDRMKRKWTKNRKDLNNEMRNVEEQNLQE